MRNPISDTTWSKIIGFSQIRSQKCVAQYLRRKQMTTNPQISPSRAKQFNDFKRWYIPNANNLGKRIRRAKPKYGLLPLRRSAPEFFMVGQDLITIAKVTRMYHQGEKLQFEGGHWASETHFFDFVKHDIGFGVRRYRKPAMNSWEVLCLGFGQPVIFPNTKLARLFVELCLPRPVRPLGLFRWRPDQ